MTRDQAKEYLKGLLNVEEPTKEQIDNLLANVNKQDQNYKKQIDDLNEQVANLTKSNALHSDYDAIKSELDDIKKANMTQEQLLAEREKALVEREKETNMRNNKSIANEILSSYGLEESVISSIITDNADTTTKNAKTLAKQLDNIIENTTKKTKEQLLNEDVKPNMDNANISTEKKYNDLSYIEKLELKRNNPSEYARLKGQE